LDGALGFNNPTREVEHEAVLLLPPRKIGCIISIGTGKGRDSLKSTVENLEGTEHRADLEPSTASNELVRPNLLPIAWHSRPGLLLAKFIPSPSQFVPKWASDLWDALMGSSTRSERTHNEFLREQIDYEDRRGVEYFRFNVEGIEKIGLDEWRASGDLMNLTSKYIRRESRELEKAAEALLR
jgi:hypothetical protein